MMQRKIFLLLSDAQITSEGKGYDCNITRLEGRGDRCDNQGGVGPKKISGTLLSFLAADDWGGERKKGASLVHFPAAYTYCSFGS